jgi:hypothetical protein
MLVPAVECFWKRCPFSIAYQRRVRSSNSFFLTLTHGHKVNKFNDDDKFTIDHNFRTKKGGTLEMCICGCLCGRS